MITYEDLLAARYLDQEKRGLRATLEKALTWLDKSTKRTSLLMHLVASGQLEQATAYKIHDQTIAHNRRKAVALYIELLKESGVSERAIDHALRKIGEEADAVALGDRLARKQFVDPALARDLRYKARVAFDRFRSLQVEKFRRTVHRAAGYQTAVIGAVEAIEDGDSPGSIDEPPRRPGREERIILSETLHDFEDDVYAPQFPIPDDVDMGDPLTGQEVAGYRVLGLIGKGAMGRVYLADSREREGPIALKLLDMEANEEARERFKREVFIQGLLPPNEHTVELYDAGRTEDGQSYIAMEYYDSTDLEQVLKVEKKLTPLRAVQIMRQVAQALAGAHSAKVVHRDLKPANILVASEGDGARLADFGIAINLDLGGLDAFIFKSLDGTVTGTAEFCSPEQAAGGPIDTQSDLYALGVLLYNAISGDLPYDSETSQGFLMCHMLEDPVPLVDRVDCEDLPQPLLDLVMGLLEKEPADRPKGAEVVASRLRAIEDQLSGSGTLRRSSTLWQRLGFKR